MKRSAILLAVLPLAACGGIQSANGRDGVEGALIGGLYDLFFWTTLAVYVFVVAYLGLAIWRGRRHRREMSGLQGEPAHESERRWPVGLIVFTGVASRRTIAAGTLPTTHASFVAWLDDPQAVKPGNHMPEVTLTDPELSAITAYLETLK